jgi:hypothetical protein
MRGVADREGKGLPCFAQPRFIENYRTAKQIAQASASTSEFRTARNPALQTNAARRNA